MTQLQGDRDCGGTMSSGMTSRWCLATVVSRDRTEPAHFSDNLPSLRIPAQSSVVLATRKQQVGVLSTPRHGQDALVVPAENLLSVARSQSLFTLSGARVFRRSHSMMMGDSSSSEAVISRVAWHQSCAIVADPPAPDASRRRSYPDACPSADRPPRRPCPCLLQLHRHTAS